MPGHMLPTRDDSCLDHVMLKIDNSHSSSLVAVLNTTVTDHNMVTLHISQELKSSKLLKYKTIIDYENAYSSLITADVLCLNIFKDPESYAVALIDMIKTILSKHSRIVSIPANKRIKKPWITTGALRCIRLRNLMQIKLRTNSHNEILKITFKRFRNFCSNLIHKLKRQYHKNKINKHLKQPKKLWSTIDDIAQYKPEKTTNTNLLAVRTTPQASVNYVNKYFVSIGQSLAEVIYSSNQFQNTTVTSHSQYSNLSSFVLLDTDPTEVDRILIGLDSNSAPGWDGISTKFLKMTRTFVVPLICSLVNLCFQEGIFPKALKRSIVTPVFKGGDKTDVNNYRPISVLTSISKIVEKLLNNRLMGYLNNFKILSSSQYGFRKGLSTQDAILALTSLIVQEVDKGNKCLAVFLDLKKAFDTVSVVTLERRLEQIGIRDKALSLFKSYLGDRKQMVRIGEHLSGEECITYGIPQGSVLGPTLFLIYINDLYKLQDVGGNIFSYADDTAIVFTGKSWLDVKNKAETGLAKVSKWLCDNLLTLNIQKTNYICFTKYANTQPTLDFSLKIHNCQHDNSTPNTCHCPILQKVVSTKYLGIMLDQRLCWTAHIELLMTRIRKLIRVFKSLRHVMEKELLKRIYIALVQSVITYCIPIWGGSAKSHFLSLERAQRALIKVMYFKPYRFPTSTLYEISGILSVRKLFILNVTLKCHEIIHFDKNKLRKRRNDLVAPRSNVRSSFAKRQYSFQSSTLYNKINRLLQIYPMQKYSCKKAVTNWLDKLSYTEIETLLS